MLGLINVISCLLEVTAAVKGAADTFVFSLGPIYHPNPPPMPRINPFVGLELILGSTKALIFLGGFLGLVPLSGMQTVGDGSFLDRLHHLILPAMVGAIGGWIGYSRILRCEVLEVLNQDYVRTARAKGLAERAVMAKHVLRNAVMPLITGLSGIFLLALSGSILFETVFSWPGMGRLAITAINTRDYPVIMGLFVIGSVLGILGLLMVDVLYSVVDPRVRYDITK